MKKRIMAVSIVALVLMFSANTAFSKEQVVCPVMGGKINKQIYTDYKGARIYFCCAMCIDAFKQNPEKYLKKMAAEGIDPAKAPVKTEEKTGHEGQGHD